MDEAGSGEEGEPLLGSKRCNAERSEAARTPGRFVADALTLGYDCYGQ